MILNQMIKIAIGLLITAPLFLFAINKQNSSDEEQAIAFNEQNKLKAANSNPIKIAENTETEAKGHGVCANCTETSVTAGKDENTNIGSVQSELNLQPEPSSAPSSGSSKGKQ